ncbi:MAG: hydroxymethylglutaryl-CoA reductase [Cyclobacteriaceae bacterium]|nr:hydroxymethylglutaryl-CoA reductase [Cyclobacteriaceae bacterium]MDH4298740.1 hydroxymethylglutaryl-CoA reductase [Cyclobacteriaceae bacterium]MDH5250728.1 hydroxymethylglutaryl-CoA reductase [Cyclobacteriaceae bacterium]
MSHDNKTVNKIINEIEKVKAIEAYARQIAPLSEEEVAKLDHAAFNANASLEGQAERLKFLEDKKISFDYVTGNKKFSEPELLKGNIENFIGMAQVPIGLAGPLLVNGTYALGDFFVPLATTEGALVASYNRGMKACRRSGGISSVCLYEGIQRCPFFKFDNIGTVGIFLKWIHQHIDNFHEIVSKTSQFAKLNDVQTNIEGNSVILTFEYSTGDAAGQNMVTICTDQICKFILSTFPVTPSEWYIESNYAGDKKATSLSFTRARGKKVTAEIVLPRKIVESVLKTTPEKIVKYWVSSTLAVIQSGAIGAQGHVANGLAALFIACGQDVACISESSIGLTRMETNLNGDLYVSLTLPSLIVGTVGGGTALPTQNECLEMLGCAGLGKAKKFAEICCAVALAGEISIAAAMTADHFTRSHKKLGRKK